MARWYRPCACTLACTRLVQVATLVAMVVVMVVVVGTQRHRCRDEALLPHTREAPFQAMQAWRPHR